MASQLLHYANHAPGRPYHAALVVQSARSEQHGHADFFEFMGVVAGRGWHLLDGAAQQLREGDVLLVRPRDRHAIQGLSPGGMTFVNVAFPAASWHGFVGLAGLDPTGDWHGAAVSPHWQLTGPSADRAAEIFRRALRSYHPRPAVLDVLRFWTDLVELLQHDGSEAAEAGPQTAAGARAAGHRPDWLARACTAMRREDNLRGGVPRMRRLAAVSAAHLSRSMREFYGITPTSFVTELRLQRAAELLSATTEPVTAIAQLCGFSSQSYFTRCFTAAHGMPPREYRHRAWHAFVP